MASKKTIKKTQKQYVICRCRDAGVHAGYLGAERGGRLTITESRRIWYWDGAGSLSELAVYGPNPAKAANCRIGARIDRTDLRSSDVCEIIYCRTAGAQWLQGAPEWRA
jgi:hypothetical protein